MATALLAAAVAAAAGCGGSSEPTGPPVVVKSFPKDAGVGEGRASVPSIDFEIRNNASATRIMSIDLKVLSYGFVERCSGRSAPLPEPTITHAELPINAEPGDVVETKFNRALPAKSTTHVQLGLTHAARDALKGEGIYQLHPQIYLDGKLTPVSGGRIVVSAARNQTKANFFADTPTAGPEPSERDQRCFEHNSENFARVVALFGRHPESMNAGLLTPPAG